MLTPSCSIAVKSSHGREIFICSLCCISLPPPASSAVVAPTVLAAPTLAAMMVVMMPSTMGSTSAPLLLRCILQLAPCNRSTYHAQEAMSSHLLAGITTCQSTTYGAHKTTLAFFALRGVRIVGSVGVTTLLPGTLLLLVPLLAVLRCGTVAGILRWWITAGGVVSCKGKTRRRQDLLVSTLALGVTGIVLAVLATLLSVLKASVLGRAKGGCSCRRTVTLISFAVLRLLRWISLVTVTLGRTLWWVTLTVVWRVLVVWV